jgi:hypothetical protein
VHGILAVTAPLKLLSLLFIYTQAVTPAKRAAQAAVLPLVFPIEQAAKDQFAERENASPREKHRGTSR